MLKIYNNHLLSGWYEYSLKDITIKKRGYSWAKEQETIIHEPGTIPVIRIPNIKDYLSLDELLYIRNISEAALTQSGVSKGWILFVGSNGNPDRIGDSALIEEDQNMIFASFLMAITSANINLLTPEYLALWMRLHRVHQTFSRSSQQTTGLANFSWSAVKNLPVRFPSCVKEQNCINFIFKSVDNLLNRTEQELTNIQRAKKSLMRQLFSQGIPERHKKFKYTKLGKIPEEWEVLRIQDVLASPLVNGVSPQSRPDPPGTPILNVSCIKDGICNTSLVTYVDVDEETFNKYQAKQGDFYVLRGNGNRDYVATGGLLTVEPDPPCIFSDLLIRLRFNPDFVVDKFIPWMWQSEIFKYRLQSKAKSGSGLWKIGLRDIRRELIACPKPDEQREIVQILNGIQKLIELLQTELESLQKLKRSLLQNLLTGKVRVNLDGIA